MFTVGKDTFIDCSATNGNAVIFEDNEETGYFYAVDQNNELNILDALHIYNVSDVVDKNKPSNIKIIWTDNFTKAILSINNYYHAIFDFKEHAGYCRNAFPNSKSNWTRVKDRLLTDELIMELLKR
ncbi:DUF2251 domain-containing protein [Rhizosphaericola mali]|uniref:DUF2251 domain-containing protein n=1 Tax=Rhizosphaericola mali TaxID=2545455 RepID=A0A5P2G4Z1_9BACT|nr:DUF2251 domain-containing protein [Rhizosphaericola mali]